MAKKKIIHNFDSVIYGNENSSGGEDYFASLEDLFDEQLNETGSFDDEIVVGEYKLVSVKKMKRQVNFVEVTK